MLEKLSDKYRLKFGKLLDVKNWEHEDKKRVIIKAEIKINFNNIFTVVQNGYNIENLILEQDLDKFEKFDEIQYWAIANDGNIKEEKVISFTINKEIILKIKNREIEGNKIIENAQDVWVSPKIRHLLDI